MIKVDDNSNITIPQGDTGLVSVALNGVVLAVGDMCIFAVKDGTTELLRKLIAPTDGVCVISLANADTENIAVGSYRWDLRVVLSPVYNTDNTDIVNGTEVHSIFSLGGLPKFVVKEVGARV